MNRREPGNPRNQRNWRACTITLLFAGVAGCRARTEPSLATFTAGMEAYLQKRGDLCLARPSWPVDVSAHDVAVGTRDAMQMPVLEKLGLVVSTPSSNGVRRYRLTTPGRARYIDRETRQPTSPDDPAAAARADFCAVSLSLDRVIAWDAHDGTVSYTYHVTAPEWARDPAFQRVFPAVARVVRGAGVAQLKEGFTLTPSGWIANDLLPAAAPSPRTTPPAAARPIAQAETPAP